MNLVNFVILIVFLDLYSKKRLKLKSADIERISRGLSGDERHIVCGLKWEKIIVWANKQKSNLNRHIAMQSNAMQCIVCNQSFTKRRRNKVHCLSPTKIPIWTEPTWKIGFFIEKQRFPKQYALYYSVYLSDILRIHFPEFN